MLVEPARTPYDLNFRLFGFRVRIHPWFWLCAGLLGASVLRDSLIEWFTWIVVVLVSIMIHELGHAIAFRLFGSDSYIVLYAFGGLAIPYTAVYRRWRRILISLAGPFAGFLLAGLLIVLGQLTHTSSRASGELLSFFYDQLLYVNICWGLFNLLPVFPLDGGQITRELCDGAWHGRGLKISLQISFWVAAFISLLSFVYSIAVSSGQSVVRDLLPDWFPSLGLYTALLFLVLAAQSYHLLRQLNRGLPYGDWSDRLPWER